MFAKAVLLFLILFLTSASYQQTRTLGKFQEVFAWKQLTYNIYGNLLLEDRYGEVEDAREKRRADTIVFNDDEDAATDWSKRPDSNDNGTSTGTTVNPNDEAGKFFVQYNNVPMGVERVGDRLFVTVPRRRHGIPSTLNFIDLKDTRDRSPALRPYPNLREARSLTSVYRTRADECGRLWMVDTGLLEIPDNPSQLQPAAIVIYDLETNTQIMRYPFKSSDIPAANTPTGLASITIDINGDCEDAYAYVPDLTTFGIIVYSLKENDSWRHSHAYFSFNPIASTLDIAGERFQWNDGVFSITLSERGADGCRMAFFHPLIGTEEFSVSTCVLKNPAVRETRSYFSLYSLVGRRGDASQSTMHGLHRGSGAVFFADVGRDAVSCWNTAALLNPSNIAILARDRQRMSYPSDLHVTGDEVWVMANTLPRFGYSRLDTNEYNFYIYRGNAYELIKNTVCEPPLL